jgi:hypothetical protein
MIKNHAHNMRVTCLGFTRKLHTALCLSTAQFLILEMWYGTPNHATVERRIHAEIKNNVELNIMSGTS